MARCYRCDACESQWDMAACKYCGYPGADTRTEEKKKIDAADYEERMRLEREMYE
jgi:hypothetical protein